MKKYKVQIAITIATAANIVAFAFLSAGAPKLWFAFAAGFLLAVYPSIWTEK